MATTRKVDLQKYLKKEVSRAGSIRALAAEIEVNPGYLYRILQGAKDPSQDFLERVGLVRVVSYVKAQ